MQPHWTPALTHGKGLENVYGKGILHRLECFGVRSGPLNECLTTFGKRPDMTHPKEGIGNNFMQFPHLQGDGSPKRCRSGMYREAPQELHDFQMFFLTHWLIFFFEIHTSQQIRCPNEHLKILKTMWWLRLPAMWHHSCLKNIIYNIDVQVRSLCSFIMSNFKNNLFFLHCISSCKAGAHFNLVDFRQIHSPLDGSCYFP